MEISIDSAYLKKTLTDLIGIESVNPSLAAGGAGEKKIAAYVARSLDSFGLETRSFEPEPERVSVAGFLRGGGAGRSLMLNAHSDTVGVEGMTQPFAARFQEGRVYGRGAYDMKGSLAACMAAAKALTDCGAELAGDLVVAAVADEEYASLGTADLIRHLEVDAAIVAEPTELDLCVAHKGFVWLQVETVGKAAHGSRFDLGIDANMRMGRVLAELEGLERSLRAQTGHPLLGPPSLHAARIRGGTELSAYAARCRLEIERRTLPGETRSQVESEIQAILDRLAREDAAFRASLETILERQAFEIAPDRPIVAALRSSAEAVLGRTPRIVGQNPWMDSAMLSAAGVDAVVMGPCGGGAHSTEEWVDLRSVELLARILAETARRYLG